MGMLVKQVMWASASCSGILLAGPTAMAADTILAALLGRGRRWDRLENSTEPYEHVLLVGGPRSFCGCT